MPYVLSITITAELIIFYYLNNRNILSPSIVSCSLFLLSSLVFAFNQDFFSYELSPLSIFVISLLLFFILLGEITVNRIFRFPAKMKVDLKPIYLPNVYCVFFSIFVFLIGIYYLYDTYTYSISVGNYSGDIWRISQYTRMSNYSKNIILSQGTLLSECILFLSFFCYVNNYFCNQISLRYVFPILAYIPHVIACDNRISLLNIIGVLCIILFSFIKYRVAWSRKKDFQIVMIAILSLISFLFLFRVLGYRTETSINNELWDNLRNYISSSLIGLDLYLNYGEPENILFGQSVFFNIYAKLREWGFDIPLVPHFESFYSYGDFRSSNIYTALKVYIKDFGYIGGCIGMYILSLAVNFSIISMKYSSFSFYNVVKCGLLFYPIVMISIQDVTASILSMTMIYTLIYIKIFDYLIFKRKMDQ